MLLRLCVHSYSSIAHCYHDIASGYDSHVLLRVSFVQIFISGFDGQFSAAGHRISGVDGQIHNYLLHLSWIGPDVSKFSLNDGSYLYVLWDHSAKQPFQICNYRIEIKYFWLHHLLATESKQVTSERSRAVACFLDLFDI